MPGLEALRSKGLGRQETVVPSRYGESKLGRHQR